MNPRRPSVIANKIRMLRPQYQGTMLLVEGRDDRLFMNRFTSQTECKIEVLEGKQNVCDVVEILDKENFPGVLGIIDADFERVDGIQRTTNNLIMPECHDLETMLIYSPALDRVINEFGSDTKIVEFPGSILDELVCRALLIAYLRLHSARKGLCLKFKGLDYSRWIDRATLEASKESLIEAIKNLSQRHDLSSKALRSAMRELERENFPSKEMCTGTDLIEIVSLGLKGALGSKSGRFVNSENLRRSLRLAYSEQDFKSSTLYEDIRRWEDQGHGFRVLRT